MSLITDEGSLSVAETFDSSLIDLAGVSGEVIIYVCMYVGILALHSVHPWATVTVSSEAHISMKYTSATLLSLLLYPAQCGRD